MDRDDPTMVWEKRWIGRPVDTHFSADDSSPLARSNDTNKLETHGVLGPRVDEDGEGEGDEAGAGPSPGALAVVAGVVVLLRFGVPKVAPHIARWRRDRQDRRNRASGSPRVDQSAAAPGAVVAPSPGVSSAEFGNEVAVALEEHRRSMSSEEAQRRILAVLLAAAFIASQMRELSNVRIDDGASAELQGAMDRLTVPELTNSLNRALEADSSVLDDETAAALMEAFGGGQVVEGQFVPLRNEKVKQALRLTRPEEASRRLRQ